MNLEMFFRTTQFQTPILHADSPVPSPAHHEGITKPSVQAPAASFAFSTFKVIMHC